MNLANASDVSFVSRGLLGRGRKRRGRKEGECVGEIFLCCSDLKPFSLYSEVMQSGVTEAAGKLDGCFMFPGPAAVLFTRRRLGAAGGAETELRLRRPALCSCVDTAPRRRVDDS